MIAFDDVFGLLSPSYISSNEPYCVLPNNLYFVIKHALLKPDGLLGCENENPLIDKSTGVLILIQQPLYVVPSIISVPAKEPSNLLNTPLVVLKIIDLSVRYVSDPYADV